MSRLVVESRVAVTGGAGFIGHHLVRALVDRGTQVLVIDDLSTGREDRLPDGATLERVDVADQRIPAMIEMWRPSVVFHLAAQASVARSMDDPQMDLRANVVGTLRTVEGAKRGGTHRLVFSSSGGAVYGGTRRPATEASRVRPESYYGIHKLAAEGYVLLGGVSHAVARPSNVYGPGQDGRGEGAVVAAFVDAARSGSPLVIHGDGKQTRDFVHVADVVDALLVLADLDEDGIWNVSSGRAVSVLALADAVESVAGTRNGRARRAARPGDVRHSRLSSGRLRATGWEPRVPLAAGLRTVLDAAGRD